MSASRPIGFPLISAIGVVLITAGCSSAPAGSEFNDPYETVNRQVHAFNVGLDRNLLDPMGKATSQLPDDVQTSIINFSDNASLPNAVFNGLLQGNIPGVTKNTLRFVLNTSIGVLGFFDPAGAIGIEPDDTDFGETLAVWGVPEGAYLELPGLGPSTERDATGRLVDFFLDPFQIFGTPEVIGRAPEVFELDTVAWGAEQVIERGEMDETYDEVLYESADSYAQLRLIYLQNRRFELGDAAGNGNSQTEEDYYFDPYEDQQQ